jgi:serine/threonine-protein kinase
VDDQLAHPPADFLVEGEVRFKRLSTRLAASGLTIEKFVLTSWTIRAVDTNTGEEIYHNNAIPQKQSWATEELALQDVGRLIGSEFSKGFFLEYFDAGTRTIRLRFTGLPATFAGAVYAEINSALRVVDTAPAQQENADMVIDTALSAGPDAASDVIQEVLLKPLNRKLEKNCFTVTGADVAEVHILFDSACQSDGALSRLEAMPPDALTDAPKLRIEDVVRQPRTLPGIKL